MGPLGANSSSEVASEIPRGHAAGAAGTLGQTRGDRGEAGPRRCEELDDRDPQRAAVP